eukprot:3939954-Pleurochrysis_carterae.AAC.1
MAHRIRQSRMRSLHLARHLPPSPRHLSQSHTPSPCHLASHLRAISRNLTPHLLAISRHLARHLGAISPPSFALPHRFAQHGGAAHLRVGAELAREKRVLEGLLPAVRWRAHTVHVAVGGGGAHLRDEIVHLDPLRFERADVPRLEGGGDGGARHAELRRLHD